MGNYLRAYAEVDLEAIGHNIAEVRKNVGSGVKICAVIKADAYGHGARVVANYISDEIDMAGVAGVSEGLELRRAMDGGRLIQP